MMIKLETYMRQLDINATLEPDTWFNINDEQYKIVQHHGYNSRTIIKMIDHEARVIGTFTPINLVPQFIDIYRYLNLPVSCNNTVAIGDILYDKTTSKYYIIASITYKNINLVCVQTGTRWSEGVHIKCCNEISYNEMCELIGSKYMNDFMYVGRAKNILKVKLC